MEQPAIFVERTLAIIKPDAIDQASDILSFIENNGFAILQVKMGAGGGGGPGAGGGPTPFSPICPFSKSHVALSLIDGCKWAKLFIVLVAWTMDM